MSNYSNVYGINDTFSKAKRFLRPPPKYTPHEWAEANIRIPMGNAIPGPIRFDNAPYQIEPLNQFANPEVERISLMWGAQTGKTQILNCAMGYFIAHDPSSQIMMQPSEGDLKTWLETKFNPMVDTNEVLKDRIAKPRGREGVNNQQMKSYPGGFLMFAWSGSPRTMRGRSAPKIFCDEVDGYEYNHEGHPVNLLWQRAATFGDQRKLLVTSTPTIKDMSFIERSYLQGDQRRYWIPCPHCQQHITLEWKYVIWKDNDPETAEYVCQECGSTISDGEKRYALRFGEWRGEKPFTGHASYHLSELYSSFRRWRDIARSFLEKKADRDLQSFVNVSLAETWEEGGIAVDPMELSERREDFGKKIPEEVLVLTAGIDTQDDRLEMSTIGWAKDDESYVIEHQIFYGDPSSPHVWNALSLALNKTYHTHDGRDLIIRASGLDTGGHHTQSAYKFAKSHAGKRVFALKGVGGEIGGKPILGRPSRNNAEKVRLYPVGVDTAKDLIYSRLKHQEIGPGYVHFSDELEDEYFKQLTSEKIVTRFHKGYERRSFKKEYQRNEALDCMVYALTALVAINVNLNALHDRLAEQALLQDDSKSKPVQKRPNFVNAWRQ